MLSTEKILLRMVEPEDATKLLIWENNPENWKVTDTEVPFSMHAIKMLIERITDVVMLITADITIITSAKIFIEINFPTRIFIRLG